MASQVGPSYFFPRSRVHAIYQGRIITHVPRPIQPGHYPCQGLPQGQEVANAPEGSMLFKMRRAVDHALVMIYAPNNP